MAGQPHVHFPGLPCSVLGETARRLFGLLFVFPYIYSSGIWLSWKSLQNITRTISGKRHHECSFLEMFSERGKKEKEKINKTRKLSSTQRLA